MDFKFIGLIVKQNDNFLNYKDNNFDIFFKELFSFNIANSLLRLTIILNGEKISPNFLEELNNLKVLEGLELVRLNFNDVFVLKLKNLKFLFISYCQNITFIEDSFLNLEELYLFYSYINIPKSLMKIPNVRKCEMKSKYYIIEDYISILDYASMTNIENLTIGINEFLDLDVSLYKCLTYLHIDFNYYDINHNHYLKHKLHSVGIKMLKKILLIKSLLFLEIPYVDINEKDKIKGKLNSVLILNIIIDSFVKDTNRYLLINKIQEKFPNVRIFKVNSKISDIKVRIDIKDLMRIWQWTFDIDQEQSLEIKLYDIIRIPIII